jgi:hypothetical protein
MAANTEFFQPVKLPPHDPDPQKLFFRGQEIFAIVNVWKICLGPE